MFYKIPLDTDLSETSYRCYKETDEAAFIEYNSGNVGENWVEITKEQAMEIAHEWFSSGSEESEPTSDPIMEKLESIEAKIQTNEELQTFYDDIVKEVGL